LSTIELYYNCSINKDTAHSPFEVMYGYQPYTHIDRLLPLFGANTYVSDRLNLIAGIRDVVDHLLKLSKERMVVRATRTPPLFQSGNILYFSTKGLHIRSRKCKHHRDQ
jgi:hypothetical protein